MFLHQATSILFKIIEYEEYIIHGMKCGWKLKCNKLKLLKEPATCFISLILATVTDILVFFADPSSW
jgi:hypothetical protein